MANDGCLPPDLPDLTARALVPDCGVKAPPGPPVDCQPADPGAAVGAMGENRRRMFARIVAVNTGLANNPYSWVQVLPAANGARVDGPRSGGNTAGASPAYAFSAVATVPGGTVVELIEGYLGQDWRFFYA